MLTLPREFADYFADNLANCLVAAILFAGAATGLFLLLRAMFYVPFMQKKWREKAESQGHFAKALLVKYPPSWSSGDGHELWSYFTYRFYVGEKAYRIRAKLTGYAYRHPDTECTVYWLKKPSRAALGDALGRKPGYTGRLFIVLCMIGFIIAVLIGRMAGMGGIA